ncbi:unnamed protein product [Clavelina lepadiformis]|uniref:Uncharacterized protein n=1 Tax=Clavelina lepadiformis TaxID=159417 RepID=A0ABP0FCZ9_CLALP
MKVIVAGYGKTGTKTMYAALSELDYKVYDFYDHYWYHGDKWAKILSSSSGSIEDFKEMYQSVDAVTDGPPYLFWEEILQAFPDAKNCPADKLLVYDVRQGWAPLCEFLGKEIPDKPFPRENVRGNIYGKFMETHPSLIYIQREMKVTVTLLSLGLLLACYQMHKANLGGTLKNLCSRLWDSIGRGWFSQ